MKRYLIIPAGGAGLRMGAELPKQFLPLNEAHCVLGHCIARVAPFVDELIVVLPKAFRPLWQAVCRQEQLPVHRIADGGKERFDSVKNALALIPDTSGEALVGIHDAVRPFLSPQLIAQCFAAAAHSGAALPAVPCKDSLRRYLTPEGGATEAVLRSQYLAVQTPQVFHLNQLREAYNRPYDPAFTDDASVYEAAYPGAEIAIVAGEDINFKLTTPTDLILAKELARTLSRG